MSIRSIKSGWLWLLAAVLLLPLLCVQHAGAAGASVLYAWGRNNRGQLGVGDTTFRSIPVTVSSLSDVLTAATGGHGAPPGPAGFTLAVKDDGTAWAWGNNDSGQLGDGTTTQRNTPVLVSGLTSVTSVSAGGEHSLALLSNGSVWAWGANYAGQVGDGTSGNTRTTPVQVPGLTNVVGIAAGHEHSLAVKGDGTVWAWGRNGNGQVGDGTNGNTRTSPVQVPGLADMVAVAGSYELSLALKRDGTVWSWGANQNGGLGDGTTAPFRSSPVPVVGLTNITSIAAGNTFGLALKNDTTVWAWGNNFAGILGNGTTDSDGHPTPTQIPGFSQVTSIAAGAHHALAAKQDGTTWAWGDNFAGVLGDGTEEGRSVPTPVLGLTGITTVKAGGFQSLAFALPPVDTTPPACVVGTVVVESPTRVYVPITLTDSGSGVAGVKLTSNSSNCRLEWDGPGGLVTAPINTLITISPATPSTVVRAVKINSAQKARVELRVADAAGNFVVCDPVIANLEIKNGRAPLIRSFAGIPQAERYVTIQNGDPGLTQVTLSVNGRVVSQGSLSAGQTTSLDIARWLRPGARNVVRIAARGTKGAAAILTIGDVAPDAPGPLTTPAPANREFSR